MRDPDLTPLPDGLEPLVRAATPARLLVGRAGTSLPTATLLALRADHAAAADAVHAELPDLGLLEVATRAGDRRAFLARPELGRELSDAAMSTLRAECPTGADFQILVGDGLSAAAVAAQVPALLPLLVEGAAALGWTVGRPFVFRQCRVGVLNAAGAALSPVVAVLLVGERPGLATAESLSAYLAYRPKPGDTDGDRNLVSNIHPRGVPVAEAARRILALARAMRDAGRGGPGVKESLPARPVPGIEE